jgi:predicted acylesterase/phospholipase RssA
MTIKHLIITGGGHTIFQSLGSIYKMEIEKYFKLEDIESIYSTSAGAMIAVALALKFDWDTLNDYVLKRPWKDVFHINIQNILDAYKKKGIYDKTHFIKCYQPLFDAKNISIDINMEDFYNLTKIELHFYTFEMNEYKLEDLSYLTHPNLSIIDALHMTSSMPIIITPVFIENKCYTDGGIACNYPLSFCIDSGKDVNEMLGFKNGYQNENNNNIENNSNLLQFMFNYLYKSVFSMSIDSSQPKIKNEIICDTFFINTDILKELIFSYDSRKKLFDNGVLFAENFLSSLES